MPILHPITADNVRVEEVITYQTQTLTTSSFGLFSQGYSSGSVDNTNIPTTQGSYYNSLRMNFYLSSSNYDNNDSYYNSNWFTFGRIDGKNPQYTHKFHNTGSLISIPQKYWGEKIKEGSVKITFPVTTTAGNNLELIDDGYGNLYSHNATEHTSSTSTAISSSDNYKGNVFYKHGIITITDTGSYADGNIDYKDLNTGSFTVKFDSTQTNYIRQYTIQAPAGQFNTPTNVTAYSGSFHSGSHRNGHTRSNISGSGFMPYVTTIGLYGDPAENPMNAFRPIFKARYPQPIKLSDTVDIIFNIKIDI